MIEFKAEIKEVTAKGEEADVLLTVPEAYELATVAAIGMMKQVVDVRIKEENEAWE